MADSAVAVTAGTGTNVDTFQITGGDHQQVIRKAKATSKTNDAWTITTTGVATRIVADISRLAMTIVNGGSGRVYLRFDSTIPTSTTADWFLEAGDRYEVPEAMVAMQISL